ncbi:IS4 family transposase [Thermicanus aegyptius]|uniref:IS4 family transposase n=1 Tax=Thermicanus aegyptius TaxID=94009 RepID=UPI0004077E42|nr:transposase [Thermicanus aegyptius]
MLLHNSPSEQYKQQLSSVFSHLKVGELLRKAGIRKASGISSFAVFQIIFLLVFQGRNLFRLLGSGRTESLPGKDVVYRFLNETRFNWRRFLQSLSLRIVSGFEKLISSHRIRVFIIDDSVLRRERSKKVELLAKVFDHVSGHFVRGYNLLTLGWSDGYSFAPIDFTLMSSAKASNRLMEMREDLDKRSSGYKRRKEAVMHKPDAAIQMLDRALKAGFTADYVLMDSWFTHEPLLQEIMSKGLHVIGMVKALKQRYIFKGKKVGLHELFEMIPKNPKAEIQGSVMVKTPQGLSLKIVFVQNRNNRREWLAILTTDLSLENAEIVRIYGMRWSIETFFKMAKSYLKLGSEFQGRSFDLMISHTTIVFSRYLVLEWERRQNTDERSFGGMFYLFADEVTNIDLKTALRQLMAFVQELLKNQPKESTALLCQLQKWISELPGYIKRLFVIPGCES